MSKEVEDKKKTEGMQSYLGVRIVHSGTEIRDAWDVSEDSANATRQWIDSDERVVLAVNSEDGAELRSVDGGGERVNGEDRLSPLLHVDAHHLVTRVVIPTLNHHLNQRATSQRPRAGAYTWSLAS